MVGDIVVALVVGFVQGVVEWLPVSSEGTVAVVLTLLGREPDAAVQLALFLHAGTATSAVAYYRGEVASLARSLSQWRPGDDRTTDTATLVFLTVATASSGVVALGSYAGLQAVVSELTGAAFVALVGGLLVVTGVVLRTAEGVNLGERAEPDLLDALVVGVLQGLAVLPGVSRSGTTVSALLLRGHPAEGALRLSFLLAVPASLGAGVLVVAEAGGAPSVSPLAAAVALGAAAVWGYVTVDALVRLVRTVAFWVVCVGLGSLAVVAGGLVALG
jgi:undecaprenyl-diphosphatase